jgi:hypothetical protein
MVSIIFNGKNDGSLNLQLNPSTSKSGLLKKGGLILMLTVRDY